MNDKRFAKSIGLKNGLGPYATMSTSRIEIEMDASCVDLSIPKAVFFGYGASIFFVVQASSLQAFSIEPPASALNFWPISGSYCTPYTTFCSEISTCSS